MLRARARRARDSPGAAWSPDPATSPPRARAIAIARGPAFSFHYEENLELLARGRRRAACRSTRSRDEALPPQAGALVLAGGFPEVFGAELEANEPLRAEVAALRGRGRPVLAECGGLLYLCRELDGHGCAACCPRAPP